MEGIVYQLVDTFLRNALSILVGHCTASVSRMSPCFVRELYGALFTSQRVSNRTRWNIVSKNAGMQGLYDPSLARSTGMSESKITSLICSRVPAEN